MICVAVTYVIQPGQEGRAAELFALGRELGPLGFNQLEQLGAGIKQQANAFARG